MIASRKLVLFLLWSLSAVGCSMAQGSSPSLTIHQLPSQTYGQMMSYVLETGDGHLAVIDGGNTQDAAYLSQFLGGRTIDHWFITHSHPDHIDALTELLATNTAPPILDINWAPPPDGVLLNATNQGYYGSYSRFVDAIAAKKVPLHVVQVGEVVMVGAIKIRVLSTANPQLSKLNDSSLVLKVENPRTVLFLGDLEEDAGNLLLASTPQDLGAFAVQMSHHGQTGVTETFYQAVHPVVAFWPTTAGIWNNDPGTGYNTGVWTTLATRDWMAKLGVKYNLVMKDGLQTLVLFGDGRYEVQGVIEP